MTFACLAIVTALFVAHVGAEGHSDECHACEIGNHSVALSAPPASLAPSETSVRAAAPVATTAAPALWHRPCAPRAPPTF
jgi:hypothetical protein